MLFSAKSRGSPAVSGPVPHPFEALSISIGGGGNTSGDVIDCWAAATTWWPGRPAAVAAAVTAAAGGWSAAFTRVIALLTLIFSVKAMFS